MSLLIKINLGLVAVFGIGLVVTGLFTNNILQENAKREVVTLARVMMEGVMAARNYTSNEIKPLLADKLTTVFLPQSVPSYAATQTFSKLHKTFPNFSYKEATLNPTNPRDRVTDWEADVVRYLRDHPDIKEFIGERVTPTGQSLYLARPIEIKNDKCLVCHSTPDEAPATMKALYGSTNGYGWKLGEIVGSQIVSVPMSVPLNQASKAYKLIMISMATSFACILLVVNLVFYLMVLRPISRIAKIADDISAGKTEVELFSVSGSDEIAVLSKAFNRMRISLEKAMALLG